MIKLETAKRLKELGLRWEPKLNGDWFDWRGNVRIYDCFYGMIVADGSEREFCTWLPRLDQLLDAIEGKGYWWEARHTKVINGVRRYATIISKKHDISILDKLFEADTPEDAAALALIWIKEQKGGARGE
jgi:hypothetical protein